LNGVISMNGHVARRLGSNLETMPPVQPELENRGGALGHEKC